MTDVELFVVDAPTNLSGFAEPDRMVEISISGDHMMVMEMVDLIDEMVNNNKWLSIR